MTGLDFTGISLDSVDFSLANLTRTNLTGANLWPSVPSLETTHVRRYNLETLDQEMAGITLGADGSPWFTTRGSIGRLDRAEGKITQFKNPGFKSELSDLVAGPDGIIWFIEGWTIWRLRPDGVFTPFRQNFGFSLRTLAAGTDRIWFASDPFGIGYIRTTADPLTGIHEQHHAQQPHHVQFLVADHAGNILSAGRDGVYRWSPDTGIRVRLPGDATQGLALRPDGTVLAVGWRDGPSTITPGPPESNLLHLDGPLLGLSFRGCLQKGRPRDGVQRPDCRAEGPREV